MPYVHTHAYVGGLRADPYISICHLCCPSHTNSRGVGAGINMQPVYLSSAVHLEPVLTYKGEVCTGKFVFLPAKGYVKVRRVCMPSQ